MASVIGLGLIVHRLLIGVLSDRRQLLRCVGMVFMAVYRVLV